MIKLFRNKKKIILALLIFLFTVSLIYRVTHPYKQPMVDTLTYSGGKSEVTDRSATRKDTGISSIEESLIKIDMFFSPPVHSREQNRNIFSGQGATDETGALPDQYSTDKGSEPPEDNKTGVEDELSSFRTFGYMERGGERILFLEKGKQIILIRKGDRIEGKYLVKDITKNELTLTVISDNESVHIDLSDL